MGSLMGFAGAIMIKVPGAAARVLQPAGPGDTQWSCGVYLGDVEVTVTRYPGRGYAVDGGGKLWGWSDSRLDVGPEALLDLVARLLGPDGPRMALAEEVKARSLRLGDFELKSGARSGFYLDLRALTLSPAVRLAAACLRDAIPGTSFEAIGGPSLGADPIVGAYLALEADARPDLVGFLVRKVEKGHGLTGLVAGPLQVGDRCVVVEDVATTGGSLLHAIDAVEAFGAKVVLAVALVDRGEGAAARLLEPRGIDFRAVLTLDDLGITPEMRGGG